MGHLFTPKELAKIYNGIKIRYNPSGYSFRDRLTEHDLKTCELSRMAEIDFDTEQTLMSLILSHWKVKEMFPNVSFINVPDPVEYFREWTSLRVDGRRITYNQFHTALFVSSDTLMFNPFNIITNTPFSESEFKKFHILDLLITACYLCTTSYSICGSLKWAYTTMSEKFPYYNLESLQYLKDGLAAKDLTNSYVAVGHGAFYKVNSPVPVAEKAATPALKFADATGTVDVLDDDEKETHILATEQMYVETVAFGLELAYLINRYTDDDTNRKIYSILTGSYASMESSITKLIYKTGLDKFVPAIELDDDPESRFQRICEYIRDPEVAKVCKAAAIAFTNHLGYEEVPSLFGSVLSFAKNYSCRTIRIKQCAILYNYCKANDILPKSDPDSVFEDGDDDDEFLGAFSSAVLGEAADASSESFKAKSMLDLTPKRSGKGKPMASGGHDGASVEQALDGLIGNFRTDMYKFTIKDVYNDTPSAKEQYEKVASSIKLVNAQLIKQIRDIKTYNVGGKYSGLSSGKLDRKNLYKYKTDKNIFYQNTYKQKECDLAIGIVLDASGSMAGRGISDGRTTMIVLHETLKALGINHSIIDHTCYGRDYQSDLRRYQCFREDKGYRVRKNYALASISAESGNCDSGALWFMEKALLRTKNKDKICLIFSDGAPTECSGKDLTEQVRHMERHGIKVIGIGIGFPNISRYYSDYANGNNLKQMLDIVADILKEYVLTKKD